MAWLKIDDQYFFNRKVLRAGRDARDLHLASMAYCAGQLSDGAIDSESLPLLGAMAIIPDAEASAAKLVEVGLWDIDGDGWQIHDYLDYNPTRETVTAKRAEAKERMQHLRGLRSPDVRANTERTSPDVRPLPSPSPSPSPSPDPIPSSCSSPAAEPRPEPNADPATAHLFDLIAKAGILIGGQHQAEQWTAIADLTTDLDLLTETFVEAAQLGKRPSPRWVEAVLRRCIEQGTRPGKWNGRARASPANSHVEDDFDWQAYSDQLAQAREDNDGPRDDTDDQGEPPP